MAYYHGVRGTETATALIPPTEVDSAVAVVVGTAPIHLASKPAAANTPVLAYTYSDAVTRLGMSDDWSKYTLSEVIYSQFSLFAVAPAVYINVLDPAKHKQTKTNVSTALTENKATITDPVLLDTLIVRRATAGAPMVKGTDYTAAYNDDEQLVLTILASDAPSPVYVSYDYLDPSQVTEDDIIGGVTSTGKALGLELVNEVYSRYNVVPGTIIAPGWSHKSGVAAVMKAKENDISGVFKAISVCDADTETLVNYTNVPQWKDDNNYDDKGQILCWPAIGLGGKKFHLSTQLAHVMYQTDNTYGGVPYASPSNKSLQTDGTIFADGSSVYLNNTQMSYINGNGIVTASNFNGGWKAWGNRTTAYPANTDPKDAFISIRRMFNWVSNTLATTYWSKVDDPGNKRLIEVVVNSAQTWLNSLTKQGALLGGTISYSEADNSETDIENGIFTFHVMLTPPTPAREIVFDLEYDIDNLKLLFS